MVVVDFVSKFVQRTENLFEPFYAADYTITSEKAKSGLNESWIDRFQNDLSLKLDSLKVSCFLSCSSVP